MAASRRTLITATLAATAAGTGTFAGKVALAVPDPIMALVEIERAAWDRFIADCDAFCRADRDARATGQYDRSIVDAAEAVSDASSDVWKAASDELMFATPTTVAGLLALIDRFLVRTEGMTIGLEDDGLASILGHVRTFLSRRA